MRDGPAITRGEKTGLVGVLFVVVLPKEGVERTKKGSETRVHLETLFCATSKRFGKRSSHCGSAAPCVTRSRFPNALPQNRGSRSLRPFLLSLSPFYLCRFVREKTAVAQTLLMSSLVPRASGPSACIECSSRRGEMSKFATAVRVKEGHRENVPSHVEDRFMRVSPYRSSEREDKFKQSVRLFSWTRRFVKLCWISGAGLTDHGYVIPRIPLRTRWRDRGRNYHVGKVP